MNDKIFGEKISDMIMWDKVQEIVDWINEKEKEQKEYLEALEEMTKKIVPMD